MQEKTKQQLKFTGAGMSDLLKVRVGILHSIIVIVLAIITNVIVATIFFNNMSNQINVNSTDIEKVEENLKEHEVDTSVHMPLTEKIDVFVTRKEYDALLDRFDRMGVRLDKYLSSIGY